ncbi:MAG: TetR/AcrR family transcriptional regulator [Clostridia bacterium]|nr:TetR/AcrR family transcriptional regulator [Clostridia bacterium]
MLKPKEKLEITKQKLITATREILDERGHDYKALTSRDIVKRAGVPLGMINYCFGSKDNLVLKVFLDSYELEWNEHKKAFLDEGINIDDPRERLKYETMKIVQILIKHYDCIKDILKYIMTSYDITKIVKSYELIRQIVPAERTDEQCKFIAFELGGILQLAVLRHQELKEYFGVDISDDKQLKKFIDEQVDKIVC